MGRLHQINAFLLLFGTMSSGGLFAQGKCSLEVRVLLPDGRRPEAPISVQEQNGRVQEKEQHGKDVEFCDLGILPVIVTVGSDGVCNQVTIRDVPVSLEETYLLLVTYDPLACGERMLTPTPLCAILLQIADSKGDWQANVEVHTSNPTQSEKTTDRFGRVLFTIRAGEKLQGTVGAQGFSTAAFTVECTALESKIEKRIQLLKEP